MSYITSDGKGTGWIPDYLTVEDYAPAGKEDEPLFSKKGVATKPTIKTQKLSLPTKVDKIREYCSPIKDQGSLASSTAHAGVGIIECSEMRQFGKQLNASRLFLYKVTRNLMRLRGDTGAYLRTTMEALRLFGAPPEEHWEYNISQFDKDPPASCFYFASNYQSIKYLRLDKPGMTKEAILHSIKDCLSKKIPLMFGFTVYESIEQATADGKIPFPRNTDRVLGGHAVMAVGYDNTLKIRNNRSGKVSTGAFLIRNSWGTSWGDQGYGYLPYDYVLRDLARDWWTIIKAEWVDTGQFGE